MEARKNYEFSDFYRKLTGRSLNFMDFIEIKMSNLQPDNPSKLLNK